VAIEPDVNLLVAGARTLFTDHVERDGDLAGAVPPPIAALLHFPLERKPWLFGAVDVFAYPSGYESFGIAFLEAWAAGKPVIGCRNSGAVPTVISEGEDGLLVRYQNADELADAILTLLRDRARAARMGEAGRAKMLANYTWATVAREFRRVYKRVVATMVDAQAS
jgi:glycosyltransferase involved in cell wall biosynthesis